MAADDLEIVNNEYDFQEEWKAISLTHVEYIKGDRVGQILAWCSLLPVVVIISFLTLILFRRDLHTISFFLGLGLDEIFNLLLKHYIKEARPGRGKRHLYTEYGMPSSHSQFSWFFASYLVLFLFIRVHHNQKFCENIWKYTTCLAVLTAASLVAYSRIYLGYHTVTQVLWGACIGILCGPLWFCVVHFILTPFFPVVTSWRISELLMIRDSTLIPNVMWFEYTYVRSEARSRQRKARKSL